MTKEPRIYNGERSVFSMNSVRNTGRSFQSLSHVRLFATPWTAACQPFLSITNSQSLLRLMSVESMMSSSHLILCCPLFSHLQSLWASGSFQISQFYPSGGQSVGVSASVLPMNTQDWFSLGWTGWISLQSKGLSRVFSNPTVQKASTLWCSAFFISNIHWIIEKAREFQTNIYFCFIDYAKAFDCVDHNKLWKILKEMGIPDHLICLLRNWLRSNS